MLIFFSKQVIVHFMHMPVNICNKLVDFIASGIKLFSWPDLTQQFSQYLKKNDAVSRCYQNNLNPHFEAIFAGTIISQAAYETFIMFQVTFNAISVIPLSRNQSEEFLAFGEQQIWRGYRSFTFIKSAQFCMIYTLMKFRVTLVGLIVCCHIYRAIFIDVASMYTWPECLKVNKTWIENHHRLLSGAWIPKKEQCLNVVSKHFLIWLLIGWQHNHQPFHGRVLLLS